ncbi:MAG: phosphodiester glycosidase family protein [Myxococcota bacterium]|nr:phosphodiester glycosidase family protein [Myxococcota bacterium]
MWRLSLGRRIILLLSAAMLSVLWAFIRIGPNPEDGFSQVQTLGDVSAPVVKRNLIKHLLVRYGLTIDEANLFFVWLEKQPIGIGQSGVAWFSAKEGDNRLADIYAADFAVSQAGIPLEMDTPVNLTKTDFGDERILDVLPSRVLYSIPLNGRVERVVEMDFGQSASDESFLGRLMTGAAGWTKYGRWGRTQRRDVVLVGQIQRVDGRLIDDGIELELNGQTASVNFRAGTVKPEGVGHLIVDGQPTSSVRQSRETIIENTALLGRDRTLKVASMMNGLTGWVSRYVMPRVTDAPTLRLQRAPRPALLWPPPNMKGSGPESNGGEGVWRANGDLGLDDALVLETFVHPDERHRSSKVWLYAFDMRRLGLGYVAGTQEPATQTGARGSGMMPRSRRKHVVATINGGLRGSYRPGGRVIEKTTVIPPRDGLATVALQSDGQPAFGLWDAESLEPPWTVMVQNLAPLVVKGRSIPNEKNGWGQSVSELDGRKVARTGLGVTEAGIVIYAWSDGVTAIGLAEAFRLAGADFAMHLGLGLEGNGVGLFQTGLDGGQPIVPHVKMNPDLAALKTRATDEFFYFYKSGRLAHFLAERAEQAKNENWQILQDVQGMPFVARSHRQMDGDKDVGKMTLYAISSELARPHFVPGLAEERPERVDSRGTLDLPGVPVFSIGVGMRAPNSPFGLTVERRVWKTSQTGIMTLVVDADGELSVGRYGESTVDPSIRWSVLVQGVALVEGGRLADGAIGQTERPAVALGTTQHGLLVFGVSERGNMRALAESLRDVGVGDALLLGQVGTAGTGQVKLFFERQAEDGTTSLYTTDGTRPTLMPADFSPIAGSSFFLTVRKPKPSARVVSTFLRVRLSRNK